MVNVQIPAELDDELQQAAIRSGRSKDDLLREVIETHLEEEFAARASFSEAEIEKLKQSIVQIERGEVYTSEQVDAFFADWFKELDAR